MAAFFERYVARLCGSTDVPSRRSAFPSDNHPVRFGV
jgi:hypothetical protein